MRYWVDPYNRAALATTGDAEPALIGMDEITASQYSALVQEAEMEARTA